MRAVQDFIFFYNYLALCHTSFAHLQLSFTSDPDLSTQCVDKSDSQSDIEKTGQWPPMINLSNSTSIINSGKVTIQLSRQHSIALTTDLFFSPWKPWLRHYSNSVMNMEVVLLNACYSLLNITKSVHTFFSYISMLYAKRGRGPMK